MAAEPSSQFPRAKTLPGGYWRDPATRRFTRAPRPRDTGSTSGLSAAPAEPSREEQLRRVREERDLREASRRSRAQSSALPAVPALPVPSAPPLEPSPAQALQFVVDSGAGVHVAGDVGAWAVEPGVSVSSTERGIPVVAAPVVGGVPVVPQVLALGALVDAGAEFRWGPEGAELLWAESCLVGSWARFVDALLSRCIAVARWRGASQWAGLGSLSLESLEPLPQPPRGVLRALDWLRALGRVLGLVLRVARRAGWRPVGSTAVGLSALLWHLTEDHEQPAGEPAPERD